MKKSQYVSDLIRLLTNEEIRESMLNINEHMPKNAHILHLIALRRKGI
jgi:hypothetical protein